MSSRLGSAPFPSSRRLSFRQPPSPSIEERLAPYGLRPHRRWDDPPLEAKLVDDEHPLFGEFHFFADGEPSDYGPGDLEWVRDEPIAPVHHGYDALVTIAVMPLPPQPEYANGDVVAWTAYLRALERRGHARALLDGICEGVWER